MLGVGGSNLLMFGLFGDGFSLFGFGKLAPMLVLLANAGDMAFMVIAVESRAAINTDDCTRGASPPNVSLHLLFLQGCIAILAYKCNHADRIIVIVDIILIFQQPTKQSFSPSSDIDSLSLQQVGPINLNPAIHIN